MSISLPKCQGASLVKDDGEALARTVLGLGWEARKRRGFFGALQSIDLDASAVVLDRRLDLVSFGSLVPEDQAIRHTGDDLTGDGDGDDEQIRIDLTAVAPQVVDIVLTVTSYRRDKFDDIENACARVVDASKDLEVATDTTSLASRVVTRR